MPKQLIMIMGTQRSGTNAFFRSLSQDKRLTCFNEAKKSPLFLNWFLRPEAEIRDVLLAAPGPVLLKPISETVRRSVSDIFEEYKDYELYVPWIYRDPVDVYYSETQHWEGRTDERKFMDRWNRRNSSVLAALPVFGEQIGIVKYEDLLTFPAVFEQVCQFFDIEGQSEFQTVSAGGRRNLADRVVASIEEGTADVCRALDAARRFIPSDLDSLK